MMSEDAVVGVTSNPTIFQKAISQGDRYDDQLKELLESGESDPKEIFLQLSSRDIAAACDLLRKVWGEERGPTATLRGRAAPTLALIRARTTPRRRPRT